MKHYLLILIAFISLIFMPVAANAAYTQLYCNADGTVGVGTDGNPSQLFYADAGTASGACEFTQGIGHIFSLIVCNFVNILNIVLGELYCGMQYGMLTIMTMVLTLYVAVFGAQILMGTAHLNAREVVTRLLKIGAVMAFVTQSAWGIGIVFRFFVGVMLEGSMWAIAGTVPGVASNDIMPVYGYIDTLVYGAITGPFTASNSKVLGLFAVMSIAFPPLFMMALYWFWTTVTMLARTLISFLLGLSAVAFLISLSPIFLSFMLFQVTFHFFETWLRYITSFSLQIVIVFGIIGMWILVMSWFGVFFTDLANVTFYWGDIPKAGAVDDPETVWGICPFSLWSDPSGISGNISLVCNQLPFDPANSESDRKQAIKPSAFAQYPEFVYIVLYNLISLIMVAYTFNALLKKAPEIAQALVGPDQAPMLTAGWGNIGHGGVTGSPNRSGWFNYRHGLSKESRAQWANKMFARTNTGDAEGVGSDSAEYARRAARMLGRQGAPKGNS